MQSGRLHWFATSSAKDIITRYRVLAYAGGPSLPRPAVMAPSRIRSECGSGCQVATQPVEHPPHEYVERMAADIRRWVELPCGGHFIALEEPELVAENIRAFFRDLR